MGDLSNRSLAALLVIAIVVSLVGTWLVVTRGPGLLGVSGRAADTGVGTADVVIETTTSITFASGRTAVDWGTGKVNVSGGHTSCDLNTSGTKIGDGCTGFTQQGVGDALVIENDGNANLAVELAVDKDATDWGVTSYKYYVAQKEADSCAEAVTPTTYTNVNKTSPGTLICSDMEFHDDDDELYVHLEVVIPYTKSAASLTSEWTATGTTV